MEVLYMQNSIRKVLSNKGESVTFASLLVENNQKCMDGKRYS